MIYLRDNYIFFLTKDNDTVVVKFIDVARGGLYMATFDKKTPIFDLDSDIKINRFDKDMFFESCQQAFESFQIKGLQKHESGFSHIISISGNGQFTYIRLYMGPVETKLTIDLHRNDKLIPGLLKTMIKTDPQ
jgi:hypothetical protein